MDAQDIDPTLGAVYAGGRRVLREAPESLTLRCGFWQFSARAVCRDLLDVKNDDEIDAFVFSLLWHSRGGELWWRAARIVSRKELLHAQILDPAAWHWTQMEKRIVAKLSDCPDS